MRGALLGGVGDDRSQERRPLRALAIPLVLASLILFAAGVQFSPMGAEVPPSTPRPDDPSGSGASAGSATTPPPPNASAAPPPGSSYLLGSGATGAPGTVTLVLINASLTLEPLAFPGNASAADPLRLPHCSYSDYNGSAVNSSDPAFENGTLALVLISYTDRTSFSGGGDDVWPAYLQAGERLTVRSAFDNHTILYEISAGSSVTLTPVDATGMPPAVAVDYPVRDASAWPWTPHDQTGNFTVHETHTWTVLEGVPLRYAGRGYCD